jgi:hypothetical protein
MKLLVHIAVMASVLVTVSACSSSAPSSKSQPSFSTPDTWTMPPQAPVVPLTLLQGTVQDLALNPLDVPESLTLATSDTSEHVIVPPELADVVALTVAKGDTIVIQVTTDTSIPVPATEHPAYRLYALRNSHGNSYGIQPPTEPKYTHVDGTLQAIHRNRNGTATSVLLMSGDVVRINLRTARQHELTVGDVFTADGPSLSLGNDRILMEAQNVNGMALRLSLPVGGWGNRIIPTEDQGDMMDNGGGEGEGDMGGDGGGGE